MLVAGALIRLKLRPSGRPWFKRIQTPRFVRCFFQAVCLICFWLSFGTVMYHVSMQKGYSRNLKNQKGPALKMADPSQSKQAAVCEQIARAPSINRHGIQQNLPISCHVVTCQHGQSQTTARIENVHRTGKYTACFFSANIKPVHLQLGVSQTDLS